ncbi:hypothetical protein [Streptomyces sp. RFCAC02]|uniref:hypothetical protein n=1 Tax=Streptomyces sp. RFCAC02 TaxID=2499143 RepID=UPI00102240EC|nr:hypothetical protein [Streptomyces sp. RFCAC02]
MHDALGSDQPIDVLNASWEAFDLGERAADAVAWAEGFDELQALYAAERCAAGRAMFFPPQASTSPTLPDPPEEALRAAAELLRHVHRALTALSGNAEVPGETALSAAALALEAAQSLESIRAS